MLRFDKSADPPPDPLPLDVERRRELQRGFERAWRFLHENPADWDARHPLLLACVVGDPASALYVDAFLLHLRRFDHSRKRFSLGRWTRQTGVVSAALRHDWTRVLETGPAILAEDPRHLPVLLALVDAHHAVGHREPAWRYVEEGLETQPKDAELWRRAGRVTASLGWFDRAVPFWRQIVAARPADAEARRMLEALDESPLDDGAASATRDVAAGPLPSGALVASLQQTLDGGDLGRAEQLWKEGRGAHGGDLRIQELGEEIQLAQHRRQLDRATRLKQLDAHPAWVVLVDQTRESLARLELEILAARGRRYPHDPELQAALAERLTEQRQWAEAARCWLVATRGNDPTRVARAWLELGEIHQRERKFAESLADYGRSLAILLSGGESSDVGREIRLRALRRAVILAEALGETALAADYHRELAAGTPRQAGGNRP